VQVISFPPGWSPLDLTVGQLDRGADKAFKGKPAFDHTRAIVQKAAQAGHYKLFVRSATATSSGFLPIADVLITPAHARTLDQSVAANVAQLKSSALPGTDVPTTDMQSPAGRVVKVMHQHMSAKGHPLTTILYFAEKNDQLYIVAFSTSQNDTAALDAIADQSIKTFRFD